MDNKKPNGSEHRQHQRVEKNLPVKYIVIDKTTPGILEPRELFIQRSGRLVDFSSTGMKMQTKDFQGKWVPFLRTAELMIGVMCTFGDDKNPVYAIAQVMWAKKVSAPQHAIQMGLKFVNISSYDLFKIRKHIISDKLK